MTQIEQDGHRNAGIWKAKPWFMTVPTPRRKTEQVVKVLTGQVAKEQMGQVVKERMQQYEENQCSLSSKGGS